METEWAPKTSGVVGLKSCLLPVQLDATEIWHITTAAIMAMNDTTMFADSIAIVVVKPTRILLNACLIAEVLGVVESATNNNILYLLRSAPLV